MQLAQTRHQDAPFWRGQVRQGPKDHNPGLQEPILRSGIKSRVRDDFGDETDLVSRTGEGDRDAFGCLLDRHLGSVVATAKRILNDASEAEDVAQETFLQLWRKAQHLEIDATGIRPWLRRVSRNAAIDRIRATRRLDVVEDVPEAVFEAKQLHDIEGRDRRQRVATAVADLPDRQRVALSLFHYEELRQTEISKVLGISVDAVESLLARARRTLKKELQDEWRALLDDGDST